MPRQWDEASKKTVNREYERMTDLTEIIMRYVKDEARAEDTLRAKEFTDAALRIVDTWVYLDRHMASGHALPDAWCSYPSEDECS